MAIRKTKSCPKCGHDNYDPAKFCQWCDFEFGFPAKPTEASGSQTVPHALPLPRTSSSIPARNIWICPSCGSANSDSVKICVSCNFAFGAPRVPSNRARTVLSDTVESIHLDGLDGFQFEELCKRIFEKLNLGRVTYIGHTADEGRDLILEGYKGGRAIVECKHWPGSSIGRLIVQKLHSATISSNARQALVVTTGHFSKEAVEYGKKLISNGIQMELVDLPILSDMARRAGIRLLTEGQSYPIETLYVSEPREITNKILTEVVSVLMSWPIEPRSLKNVEPGILEFRTSYLVTYNLHQDFVTSVGRIHSIHANKRLVLVNGVDGQMIDPDLAGFILSSSGSEGVHPGYDDLKVVRQEFKLDLHTLQEAARTHIINLNTQSVRYSGT